MLAQALHGLSAIDENFDFTSVCLCVLLFFFVRMWMDEEKL